MLKEPEINIKFDEDEEEEKAGDESKPKVKVMGKTQIAKLLSV